MSSSPVLALINRTTLVRALESLNMDLGDYRVNCSGENHNGSRVLELTIVNKDGQFPD